MKTYFAETAYEIEGGPITLWLTWITQNRQNSDYAHEITKRELEHTWDLYMEILILHRNQVLVGVSKTTEA